MLKEIVTNIKNKIQEKRQKIKLEYRRKYFEIRGAVIKFYEDKATTDDTIELPAFMRADEILKEVNKNSCRH